MAVVIKKKRKSGFVARLRKGRVCKKHGCKQRLSVYNSQIFCNVHLVECLRMG